MTEQYQEDEATFIWISKILAEIQSNANKMVQLGFGKKVLRENYAMSISSACESLRYALYELLQAHEEDSGHE